MNSSLYYGSIILRNIYLWSTLTSTTRDDYTHCTLMWSGYSCQLYHDTSDTHDHCRYPWSSDSGTRWRWWRWMICPCRIYRYNWSDNDSSCQCTYPETPSIIYRTLSTTVCRYNPPYPPISDISHTSMNDKDKRYCLYTHRPCHRCRLSEDCTSL